MSDGPNPLADWGELPSPAVEPSERDAGQAVRSRRRRGWTPARILGVIAAVAAASGAALVLTLGGSASALSNETTLRGGAFTVAYPTGWTLKVTHPVAGVNDYELTSNRGTLNELGIPPAGDTGITIEESADATLAAEEPIVVPRDPLKLLPDVIGTPKTATNQVISVPLHATTLDGAAAAATTYTYTNNGVGDVQSDVVSHHGDEVASIELDIEPGLAPAGTAALNALIAQWHWTGQGIVVDPASLRYPPALQSGFLGSCERNGSTALCGCTLRHIEARVPLAAFVAFGAAVEKGQIPATPRWLAGAEKACVNTRPVSPAPGGQHNSSSDAAAEKLAQTAHVGRSIPTCAAAGVTAAIGKEGICTSSNLDGNGEAILNVVDAGHTMHMPGYDLRLIATRVISTRVTNPALNPGEYPGGRGWLVSFELSVTNTGSAPVAFDASGDDTQLSLPYTTPTSESLSIREIVNPNSGPGMPIADRSPIAAHASVTAWVSFVAPDWTPSDLHARSSDLIVFPVDDTSGDYLGELRLWKWANARGRVALGLPRTVQIPALPSSGGSVQ